MSLTKIGSIGINTGISFAGVTTIATLNASDNVLSVGGTVNFVSDVSIGGTVSIAGTLTYEDVTNVDAVGLITARDGIVVGSGITLSADGDGFYTGVVTATSFSGSGALLTGVASTENIRTNTNATFLQNINVSGTSTVGGDIIINSSGPKISLNDTGQNPDYDILNTDGVFQVNDTTNGAVRFRVNTDGHVDFLTNVDFAAGIDVTGTVAATSYTGDGSALTGIAVGVSTAVATGITGITTVLDLSKNDHKITVSGITTVDVRGGTEGDSHSLRIINSGITTVGFSTYFLFPSGSSPVIPTADGTLSMISFTVHRQGVVGLATQLFAGASVNFS